MRRLIIELRAALGSNSGWKSWNPAVLIGVWLLIAVLALILALLPHHSGISTVMMFSWGAFYVTFTLATTILPMLADLRGLCVPGRVPVLNYSGRVVSAALLCAVVLPVICLTWVERSTQPVMFIMSAAIGGALLPRIPRPLGLVLIGVPVGLFWISLRSPPLSRAVDSFFGQFPALRDTTWLSLLVLGMLFVWLWRKVLRNDLPVATLQAAARRAVPWQRLAPREGERLSGWSSWWFTSVPRTLVLAAPARIIRPYFGPLYLPGSRAGTRAVAQTTLVLALIVAQCWWTFGSRWGLRVGVLAGLMVVWFAFGLQVKKILQRANGELAELALLPGLGDRQSQTRALCQAALITPFLIAAALTALAMATAFWERPSWSVNFGMLLWVTTATLLGITFMVTVLARGATTWVAWLAITCLTLALTWWMLIDGRSCSCSHALSAWTLPVIGCILLAASVRRLQSLPHPFVLR